MSHDNKKIICSCGWKGKSKELIYFNDTFVCPECKEPNDWELDTPRNMTMNTRFAKWFLIALLPLINYYWRYWVTKKIIELEEKNVPDEGKTR